MSIHLAEFINHLNAEKNYSEHTLINYESDIKQYINEMNIKSVDDLTKTSIIGFISILKNKGIGASSRNRKLSAIKSLCKYLVREGHMKSNPTIDIECAKTEKRLPITFNEDEISNVIDSATYPRDRAILELLYGLGIRVDELVNIRRKDVNFTGGMIRVFGKGKKERILPMNEASLEAVKEYVRRRKYKSEWLFPSSKAQAHKPITDRTVRNIVYLYSKKLGLSNMSPHKFRHSCATHMHQSGMDIRIIQEMLGHADISTTTIYTKVGIESLSKSYHEHHPRG